MWYIEQKVVGPGHMDNEDNVTTSKEKKLKYLVERFGDNSEQNIAGNTEAEELTDDRRPLT